MATPQDINRLKAETGAEIIIFRCGDFYEIYKEDAEQCAEITGVTITHRRNNKGQTYAICGFPFHALNKYLPMIMKVAGKVAIVDNDGVSSYEGAEEVEPEDLPQLKFVQYAYARSKAIAEKLVAEGYKSSNGENYYKETFSPKYSAQVKAQYIGTDGVDQFSGTNYYQVTLDQFADMKVKPMLDVFYKPMRWHDFDGILEKVCDEYKGLGWMEISGNDLHESSKNTSVYFVY